MSLLIRKVRAYTIHAEVPDAKKEDLKVTIDGNPVAISAELKRTPGDKTGGRVVHSERYYGNLYRSFSLDRAVDEAGGSAK
jgi:HSP20 family protein